VIAADEVSYSLGSTGGMYPNCTKKGELGMKKFLCSLLAAGFVLVSAASLSAGTLNNGKAWLEQQNDPVAINVNGTWSSELGDLHLVQAPGSRDVTGTAGKHDIIGVVSGKRLYLLFTTHRGTVDNCATLSSESDTILFGNYQYRTTRLGLGAGLCEARNYPLEMRKR